MWQRSGLAARDFGALVGSLADQMRGAPRGSRLTDPTQHAILMLKQAHPEWGCERIRDVLLCEPYRVFRRALGVSQVTCPHIRYMDKVSRSV